MFTSSFFPFFKNLFSPSFPFFPVFHPAEICMVQWGGAGVGGGGTSSTQGPSSPSPSRERLGFGVEHQLFHTGSVLIPAGSKEGLLCPGTFGWVGNV